MSSYTAVENSTMVDVIEDSARNGIVVMEPEHVTACGDFDRRVDSENDDESEDDESEDDDSEDDDSEDDASDDSYSSSSSEDEDEIASASHTRSNVQLMHMRRNRSFPSLVEHELSSIQINVLLNQMTRRGSMTHASVASASGLLHIRGEAMESVGQSQTESQDCKDPTELYHQILTDAGYTPRVFAHNEIDSFFEKVTESRVSSYTTDLIAAVKTTNIEHLRALHSQDKSKNMNSCNRFGESILHTACRHGQVEVVEFLLNEAQVDPRVCDDFGRTPCHDAAWQAEPNVALMEIATRCPDLLLISDKRGFTPLQYVRKPQWSAWGEMLEAHKEEILPKQLLLCEGNH